MSANDGLFCGRLKRSRGVGTVLLVLFFLTGSLTWECLAVQLDSQTISDLPTVDIELPTVDIELPTEEIKIAQPFEVKITVVAEANDRVVFPAPTETWGVFDVVDTQDAVPIDAPALPGRRVSVRTVTLDTISPGTHTLPPIAIATVSPGGSGNDLLTQPQSIEIVSTLEKNDTDPLSFREMQPAIDAQLSSRHDSTGTIWWIFGIVAVILLIVGLAYVILRFVGRRKNIRSVAWAIGEIDRIEMGTSEQVFGELESVLRRFLGHELNFPARSASQAQLLAVAGKRLGAQHGQTLEQFLDQSQLARYAGQSFTEDETKTAIARLRTVVEALGADPKMRPAIQAEPKGESR